MLSCDAPGLQAAIEPCIAVTAVDEAFQVAFGPLSEHKTALRLQCNDGLL